MAGEKLLNGPYLSKLYEKVVEGPGSILSTERKMDQWHNEMPGQVERDAKAKKKAKREAKRQAREIEAEVEARVEQDAIENLGMPVDEWDKLHPATPESDYPLWLVQQERKDEKKKEKFHVPHKRRPRNKRRRKKRTAPKHARSVQQRAVNGQEGERIAGEKAQDEGSNSILQDEKGRIDEVV